VEAVVLAICGFALGLWVGDHLALRAFRIGLRQGSRSEQVVEITADTSKAVAALQELDQTVERVRKATETFHGPGWWVTTTTPVEQTDEQVIEEHGLGDEP